MAEWKYVRLHYEFTANKTFGMEMLCPEQKRLHFAANGILVLPILERSTHSLSPLINDAFKFISL